MNGAKIAALAVAGAMALGACGCASSGQQAASSGSTAQSAQSQQTQAAQKDFDGSKYSDTGAGTFMLNTAAGTSEGGKVPKITVQSSTSMMQIEFDTDGFDRSKVTYVYVDGMQGYKGNCGKSQVSLSLKGDTLKSGTHTVEAAQFDSDQPGGNVVLYKKAQYAIA